jgi:hypothetical protein
MSFSKPRLRSTGSDVRIIVNHVLKRNRGFISFSSPRDPTRARAQVYQPCRDDPAALFCELEVIFTPDSGSYYDTRIYLYDNPVNIDSKTCRWLVRKLSEYQVMAKLST